MIKEQIEKDLKRAVEKSLGIKVEDIHLEHPQDPEHGDYATNVAMMIAGKVGKTPKEVASVIAQFIARQKEHGLLSTPLETGKFANTIDRVEVAEPGFINFWLADEFLVGEIQKILEETGDYGRSKVGKGKTVVVDYSSPNIAKPFGIGHLRSTIIGQAIYNLHKFLGYKVVGDNHLGDWGTQFGKLIYAIKTWGDEEQIAKDPIKKLNELYVEFHRKAAKDPSLEEEGRRWFKRLSEGDPEARRLWEKCVDWSLAEFNRIYDILGVKIDYAYGESFYEGKVSEISEEAKKLSIAKESKGALIIPVGEDLPPLMLLKSDGTSTYAVRDLATIKFRQEEFGPASKMIYEVGADQSLHFKQLFLAAEKFPWGRGVDFVHVPHGMMRFASGKMSTRRGRIVPLRGVIDSLIEKAGDIVEEKNPGLSESEKARVAYVVATGALKYNDLSQNPRTDIVFDWEKALSLEGNSAPYLQYTYARARSVIRKAAASDEGEVATFMSRLFGVEETALLRTFYKFPEVVEEAAEAYSPNLVCNFLFNLAQKYNLFYNRCPILKAETDELKDFRLALTAATAQILKNGLTLLGIGVLERM